MSEIPLPLSKLTQEGVSYDNETLCVCVNTLSHALILMKRLEKILVV